MDVKSEIRTLFESYSNSNDDGIQERRKQKLILFIKQMGLSELMFDSKDELEITYNWIDIQHEPLFSLNINKLIEKLESIH